MNWNVLSRRARRDTRASLFDGRVSISVYGLHRLNPVQLTADPFEWNRTERFATGRYPGYASTMSRSDGRISMARPCLLGSLGHASDTAIPKPALSAAEGFRRDPLDGPLRSTTPARRGRLAE